MVLSQESSCPVFGENQTPAGRRKQTQFYMNFDKPSLCNGTVISWQYCYYESTTSESENGGITDFGARFSVYRRVNETQLYKQVSGSAITVTLKVDQVERSGCQNITLNESQQFRVERNDIIGGCIINNSTINPLYIVGRLSDGSGTLYRSGSDFSSSCAEEFLNLIAPSSQLFKNNGLTLHLSAEVGKCRVYSRPCM